MKTKIIIVLISLGILFVLPSAPFAEENEERALIEVAGLYCPFCAYGLEKHVKKINGFKSIEINIKEGTAEITFKPGTKVSKDSIFQAVEDAGFELDSVKWIGKESKK